MKKTNYLVSLDEIKTAKKKMSSIIATTPCVYEWYSSNMFGAEIYMKLENMNIVKSFKIRGALNSILNLDKKKVKGVITASAGNHAQGVAYSATKAGIKSIIVMPDTAPLAKINATKGFGGTVVADKCHTFDECNAYAQEQAKKLNYTFIPPFDSKDVIAGQGTIGLELMDQVKNLDIVIVQIGGGGLIAGVASAVKQINPKIKIVGVQAQNFPAMVNSWKTKKLHAEAVGVPTLADGMAVKQPGKITYAVVKDLVDQMVTLTEEEISNAIEFLQEKGKIVAEGAGACGMAAILAKKVNVKGKKVAIIISGGNIDPDKFISVNETVLNKQGRQATLTIKLANKKAVEKLFNVAAKCEAKLYHASGCAACVKCVPIKTSVTLKVYFPNKEAVTKFSKSFKIN